MKPIRSAAVVLNNKKILLMHRIKNGNEYYVFPGGGVEENETPEETVIREILEETSLEVELERLLYIHDYTNSEGRYFLCKYLGGEVKLGDSIEKERMEKGKNDFYNPEWIETDKLTTMLVYPLEIKDLLIENLKSGFSDKVIVQQLNSTNLRKSL